MPGNIIRQNQKGLEKDAEIAARRAEVQEGKDTQAEIVKKIYEEEKREDLVRGSEVLEEELHQQQSAVSATVAPAPPSPQPVVEVKSEFLLQIENILAQGLGDVYVKMGNGLKMQFKKKGEEVARKIERVIAEGRAKIKQIINWIKDWLKMIPGVNRFFLEQEAKIKADKIFGMASI